MELLRQKYADRDVAFVSMYVREPHPRERGFRDYGQHKTYDQKVSYARELVEIKDVEIPVVVDTLEQRNHAVLGNLPNMAYVVDKQGIVQYARTWLLADDVDETLARLVTADDPSRPVEPTIQTAQLGSEI